MTPQERQLVDDLFDRLGKVEAAPRDPDAQAVIADGQRRAPNALYALVQTVLLQDEALKRAHDRITELEGSSAPEQAAPGGFLDTMRDALFGGSNQGAGQPRGSVPSVRPGEPSRAAWNTGQVMGQPQQGGYGQQGQYGQQPQMGQQAPQPGRGGSFLGTAAAAAAGMVGGSLLMNSLGGMMGGGNKHGFGDSANASESKSPWSSDSSERQPGQGGRRQRRRQLVRPALGQLRSGAGRYRSGPGSRPGRHGLWTPTTLATGDNA